MERDLEHELCANCKKEIPQPNYVMHTAHCARNITLCKICLEPIPKAQFEDHKKTCQKPIPVKKPSPPPTTLEKSSYFQQRKAVEDKKLAARRERQIQKYDRIVDNGYTLNSRQNSVDRSVSDLGNTSRYTPSVPPPLPRREEPVKKENKPPIQNGALPRLVNPPPKTSGLLACKYCDLELPKLDLEEHENYCGSRTDKCLECGELVMFKHKQVHLDTNHGFLKLNDEPGPRPSWDSTTQRSPSGSTASGYDVPYTPRRRPMPFRSFTDMDYDPLAYLPPSYSMPGGPPGIKIEKGESYKEISRRLDCKTEYIRNLLHDSASITVPIRHSGTAPRNHFNHNKGPAPQPPRRRNPPTELTIPCEFCHTPVPHEDLVDHEGICRLTRKNHFTIPCAYCQTPILQEDIALHETCCRENQMTMQNRQVQVTIPCEFCDQLVPEDKLILHETGCRPDLAQRAPRRRRSPEPDDYFVAPQPSSPEVELPCEFCADMIPASQLLRHQATCS